MCDAIISAYFKSIAPKPTTDEKIQSLLVYPRTKNIKPESFEYSCFYSCDDNKNCDFSSCEETFKNSSNTTIKNETTRFISSLKTGKLKHVPDIFDGFQVTYNDDKKDQSINFLNMKNSKLPGEGRTGVYDLNEKRIFALNN